MFIVLDKIIADFKKDSDNKPVRNPASLKPIANGYKVVQETIRLDEIKSGREFHAPNQYSDTEVGGNDITVIYMKGGKAGREHDPSIHIKENIKSFNQRIHAVSISKVTKTKN